MLCNLYKVGLMMKISIFLGVLLSLMVSACGGSTSSSKLTPSSSSEAAAAKASFNQANGWVTDADGHVIIFHGFNMVAKETPYTLESVGFDDDDGAFLAEHGFNAIRLGFMWKAAEPEPDQFNEGYLNSIERTVNALGKHKVLTLLDFHQDAYNEAVEGQGFPDWTVYDDGIPWLPLIPKEAQLVYQRVWDNFWANKQGVNNTRLWDHFANFWQHIATRFRNNPNILGYDLMNEPWPGLQTPLCLNPLVCPHNDTLSKFYGDVILKIRQYDANTPFYYEGSLLAGGGMALDIDIKDPNTVLSFHNYCLLTVVGAIAGIPTPKFVGDLTCPELEKLTFDNSITQAQTQGHPAVLTEFGSVPDLDAVERVAKQADDYKVGWMHWTYFNTGTTNFPGTPSLVLAPSKAPTTDNINTELLKVLSRPYPQKTAGTPVKWDFDSDSKVFDMSYTTLRADGAGSFAKDGETTIFVPKLHYPNGYKVSVSGGNLISEANAPYAVITANNGASQVAVKIEPRL